MKRLLVALDGSPRAPDVLKAAVAQAQATGAELVLLRAVVILGDLPFTAMAMSPADVLSALEQRAKAELTELATGLVPNGLVWEPGSSPAPLGRSSASRRRPSTPVSS